MEDCSKHQPSWFGLGDSAVQNLAQEVLNNNDLFQSYDDILCRQCQDLRLDTLFSGARCPSEEFNKHNHEASPDDRKEVNQRWEIDPLKHIRSLRAVRSIACKKSCALCRVLTLVHERAHPNCKGENENCLLLPVRGDYEVSIESGKLSIEEGPRSMHSGEQHTQQYGTNIHVLFRSRPPGNTRLDNKANSHFRDEAEHWVFRLDVRDAFNERLFYNHAVRTSDSINWANLKTWLSLCTSTGHTSRVIHERCHNNEHHLCRFLESCTHEVDRQRRIEEGPSFRCIDVETQRLVQLSLEDHYIALSYVWGAVKVSRDDVLDGDELRIGKLPKVILDAMAATRKLDERYLWVDLICIDQSDPKDVQSQIERMDLIYRLADVTLVATMAEDANCALPGVTSPRPVQEHTLQINGSRIYCSLQANHHSIIEHSTWNTRGWTFQERILPRRCLHFLDSEVIFQCKQSSGYELQDASGPILLETHPELNCIWVSDDITLGWNFTNYEKLVHHFSSRKFTYESDMMNAFLGITAWLRDRYGRKFIFGLPIDETLTSLMWTFRHGIDKSSRRSMFPSWTWADWRGQIEYRHYINFYRGEVSVVGPGLMPFHFPYPKVKIVQQALIHPDYSQSPVRRLNIDTDVRRFKVIDGPPETTLDEATEEQIHRMAVNYPKEIEAGRDLFYMIRSGSPRPQQYDQHFVDQDGRLVLPQAPEPNFFLPNPTCYQEVRLGSHLADDERMCTFLLLAHVADADEDEDNWVVEESAHSQEEPKVPCFDHAFTMLVRALPDGTFERVDLFTWRAEDWFKAEQIFTDQPVLLV